MTRVRIALFQHALAHPEANSERFESIEAKLDELRSYLYANRESVRGYAEAHRNGERVSTAHVESTVNQLINWRMCKTSWTNPSGPPSSGISSIKIFRRPRTTHSKILLLDGETRGPFRKNRSATLPTNRE